MKIAIYGVSRSGKDYLIEELIEYLIQRKMPLYHMKGSETLNEISMSKYQKQFKLLAEAEKDICRKEFISRLSQLESQYKNIVVDGHYSFFDRNMYLYDAFTEDDLDCYDHFFYLDTDADNIIERMRLSTDEKRNDVYTKEDILQWKAYELDELSYALIGKGKELHIINYRDEKVLEYISEVMEGKYSSPDIAKRLVASIELLNEYNTIILVDCDKTLSLEDTTNLVLKSKGIDGGVLKNIYQGDRYSNYQAVLAKEYLQQIEVSQMDSIAYINENITINKELIQDLKSKKASLIIGITAGDNHVWESILKNSGLEIMVLDAEMIMSRFIKYYVMKELQSLGKYVIAIGDSMLDSLMLEYSNKSYIVSNKGYRDNIYDLLSKHGNIHQLSYNQYRYESIMIEEDINSIKTLDTGKELVKSSIEVCKSGSGIEGKKLREAHYLLGGDVAEMIKADFCNARYVVVIMMRSGLVFGQGIADCLDCPELFYDESSAETFIRSFLEDGKYKGYKIIVCDGVINSGKTIKRIVEQMAGYDIIIAANVISSKFKTSSLYPIYASRISRNSFVGSKQRVVSNGKGPDTSDRLFRTI